MKNIFHKSLLTVMTTMFLVGAFAFVVKADEGDTPEPVNNCDVSNYSELNIAIAECSVIEIKESFSTENKTVLLNRNEVTINGNGHSVNRNKNNISDWDGGSGNPYVFQVWGATGVAINGLSLTGANAALQVGSGASVSVSNIDVSGNGFGGIEVTGGSTLNINEITNSSEAYKKPTVWVDGTGTVTGLTFSTDEVVTGQVQYYLNDEFEAGDAETLLALLVNSDIKKIKLISDISSATDLVINSDFSIDGNSKIFTGGILIDAGSNKVSIKDLTVTGSTEKTEQSRGHGINIYNSSDVSLEGLVISDNAKSGVTINGSVVSIKNITTSNNGWGGINIGKTTASELKIEGNNTHSEKAENSPIWIDTPDEQGTFTDVDGKYVMYSLNDQKTRYQLKPVEPTSSSPTRRVSGSSGGRAAIVVTAPEVTTQTEDAGEVLGETSYKFTTFMKVGSRGAEVMELQKFLNTKGASLAVDGVFGPLTKAAVMKFQADNGLVADGIVGPLTRAVLNK